MIIFFQLAEFMETKAILKFQDIPRWNIKITYCLEQCFSTFYCYVTLQVSEKCGDIPTW